VCRAPLTTSKSSKNASGQEAFGSKAKETSMEQSPAVLTACVTSTTAGTGATAASAVEKAGTSTAPRAEGGGRRPLHDQPAADVPPADDQGGRYSRGG
jgi:hypothetical protein